jgi:hypothetical protein
LEELLCATAIVDRDGDGPGHGDDFCILLSGGVYCLCSFKIRAVRTGES